MRLNRQKEWVKKSDIHHMDVKLFDVGEANEEGHGLKVCS